MVDNNKQRINFIQHATRLLIIFSITTFAPYTNGAANEQQIQNGTRLFSTHCASCHLPNQFAKQLSLQWSGKTQNALFQKISASMPPERIGELSQRDYLDIVASLLYQLDSSAKKNHPLRLEDKAWRARIIATAANSEPADQPQSSDTNWQHYRGDVGASAYVALEDLSLEHFKNLSLKWSLDLSPFGPSPETNNPSTPIVIDGVMIVTAGLSRNVLGIDANSGQLLWMFRPKEGMRLQDAPRKGAGRGVSYWQDSNGHGRILTVTPGFQLVALDINTGLPISTFGDNGYVDLMVGLRLPPDGSRDIGSSSPPLVANGVIVVGPAHATSMIPKRLHNVKGDVRGYDANTGKLLWTFHTIPKKSDPAYQSWQNESAETTGNAGVWAPMSADPELGLVYLPVEASTHDIYGGHRPGSNLYANSLVALDIKTGIRKWHHQLVHHDLWDWDLPSAPILVDIPDGKKVVVQLTKQGFAFVFDRANGEPIWPLQELPAPASDVPGEHASATQPAPSLPPPFERQGFTLDDVVDFTPELRQQALDKIKRFRLGKLFSPPSLLDADDGTVGTLILPGAFGGANWEGGAADTQTGMLFISSITRPSALNLRKTGLQQLPFVSGERHNLVVEENIPIVKPPWGRISAIDLKNGSMRWQIANADAPKEVLDNPALAGLSLPKLGKATRSGLLVSANFLIAGEGRGGDPFLRAIDKSTGKELAKITIAGTQTGLPMAFKIKNKSYIAMTVSDKGQPSKLLVYSY